MNKGREASTEILWPISHRESRGRCSANLCYSIVLWFRCGIRKNRYQDQLLAAPLQLALRMHESSYKEVNPEL